MDTSLISYQGNDNKVHVTEYLFRASPGNQYNVRNPKFHLPAIKHDFAKQLIQHCLIKLLNKDENISEIANKVFDQTFCMFKSTLKNKVITSYNDKCIDPNNCVSCKRMALDVHGLVGVDVVDGVDGVDAIDGV